MEGGWEQGRKEKANFSVGEVELRKRGWQKPTEEAAGPLVAVTERINSRHMFPASVVVAWTGGVSKRGDHARAEH